MNKIHARQIVEDVRSGLEDGQLMAKYQLSRKGLQRVLRKLVKDRLIRHKELYEKSSVYRRITDVLAARRSPRLYVPLALTVYCHESGQKGFIRDISDHGVRVAGIPAKAGDMMIFDLPLTEINGVPPLQFEAVCRWAQVEGRSKKYPVGGFEITSISEEARIQLSEMRDLILSETRGEEGRLRTPLNVSEILKSAGEMRAQTEPPRFSGTVDDVDILDFVQFMLLICKNAVLEIHSLSGDMGNLYLEDGRIVHAVRGETVGRQAFFECMSFQGGSFSTRPWHDPGQRSINVPGDFLLIEAARMRDEGAQL